MKLPTEIFGEVVVVHTPEELSADTAGQLEAFLTNLDRSQVIIDLNGSETIESGGLEAILNAQETLLALGGDIKISTTNESNRKILEMTRLDQQLEVFETVIDAVKSFAG
ncbi:Putative anti-sigma factor antagonist [Anatilimnocola aggregata]|uniref:Anti-sigma factor antagonist n=1 Tax=Anatilimnocola aggregata TaxID=2528021 RepID=A0A517YJB3_9BACT|nr:STAS domain-containing protein [Anatilimnocola aggregata]QDU30310.1 Putative anti-sigma factor antagonist [Anatilimnocola aggregata]